MLFVCKKDMVKKECAYKFYSAFMLVVLTFGFVFIIPLAKADDGGDDNENESGDDGDNTGSNSGTEVRMGVNARVRIGGLRDEIKEVREANKEARDALKEAIKDVREKQKEARERFLEFKTELRRQRIDANLSGTDALERAKDFASSVVERVISKLEALYDRINDKDVFLKDKVLAAISAEIEYYRSLLPQIENTTSRSELQYISKDVKQHWLKTKVKINKYFYLLKNKEIINVAERLEGFANKVDQRLEEMNESGHDVATLQSDIQTQVFAKIASAKQNYEEAKDILEGLVDKDVDERNTSLREAVRLLDEAKKFLREAHQSLKNIVKNMRSLLSLRLEGNAGLSLGEGSAEVGAEGEVAAEV